MRNRDEIAVLIMPVGGKLPIEINIPQTEKIVLEVMKNIGEAIAPDIVRSAQNRISLAAVYQLLKRLVERGIVSKREEYFELGGLTTRRVFYVINAGIDVVKLKNESKEMNEGEISSAKKTKSAKVINEVINSTS